MSEPIEVTYYTHGTGRFLRRTTWAEHQWEGGRCAQCSIQQWWAEVLATRCTRVQVVEALPAGEALHEEEEPCPF